MIEGSVTGGIISSHGELRREGTRILGHVCEVLECFRFWVGKVKRLRRRSLIITRESDDDCEKE